MKTAGELLQELMFELRRNGPDVRSPQGSRQLRLLQALIALEQRVAELESEAAP